MKWNDAFPFAFKNLRKQYGIAEPSVHKPMIECCRADAFDFFRPAIDQGLLTEEQMRHACQRYRLGKSKSGRPIFWMIDELGQVLDGHIGNSWVSTMLKARQPQLLSRWHPAHCLFGLHLLSTDEDIPICVVERETSAIILSELFPDHLWLAIAYTANFTIDQFAPLKGRRVTLFPHTDETMSNYVVYLEFAAHARQVIGSLTVSPILEDHASPEQKAREIDLLDFCLESKLQQ